MAEDHPTSGGSTSIDGDQVAGDKVGGDKMGGDKVGGDKYNVAGDLHQHFESGTGSTLPPEANKALEEFKRAVHKGDVASAEQALQALKAQHAAFPQLWQHVESAEVLYRILTADAGADLADLFDQIPEDWAAEAAATFVFVCERLQVFTIRQLREAYKQLRLYQVKDHEDLLVKIHRIAQNWVSDQALKWPLYHENLPRQFDPFKKGNAADEIPALFGKTSIKGRRAAFWPGHPLFGTLGRANRPQLISSAEGAGRTALSLALGRYVTGLQFSLYMSVLPERPDLIRGYAGLFLQFIQYLPARLETLTSEDFQLLAGLLCAELTKAAILARLKSAQINPESGGMSGLPFIRQLAQYVKTKRKAAIGDDWPNIVGYLARRLGFEGVRLVIDSADTDPTRLNSDLFARFERWQDSGLVTLLFAPQTIIENLETPYSPLALEWKPDDLREMVNHRYQCAVGPRTQIEKRFDSSETLQYLLDVSYYNPRRFMAFWRMLERARPGKEETFDAALVTMVRSAA